MIFKTFIILFSLTFICSCSKQNSNVIDTYKPKFTASELETKLELAFKNDSLQSFFNEWNNLTNPNEDDFINQNDTVAAVFNTFQTFYNPSDLSKLGGWEWGNSLNSNSKLIVVQNIVFYTIMPTDDFSKFEWRKTKLDSVTNFRPAITSGKNNILYLTKEYKEAINRFLGSESSELGEGNIMNPARPKGESENRYKVLRPFIPILHGHWGGYWHIETHPKVEVILFNKTLTKARIDFRVGYQGGEAILERKGNDWKIIKSNATWIE
jgi:hypothetical protein